MTAAATREELARIGGALLATSDDAGPVRARTFAGRPSEHAAIRGFDALMATPDWLRSSPSQRARIARRVALAAMAPSLAVSIDGAWLGEIAKICGEDELDRALATVAGEVETLPACPAAMIEARGFTILRQSLPPQLRRFVPGEGAASGLSDARVHALVAEATREFA